MPRTLICAFVALGLLGCAATPDGPRSRPNIVLVMADDLGFSDIGCYGGEIATPNLDRLAADGLRFTQFYNAARCCPTRASLLTGLYPHQTDVGHMVKRTLYPGDLNRKCVTIAEVLRGAGYATTLSGKWHVTPWPGPDHNWPRKRGFDRFYGTIASIRSYYNPPSLSRDDDPLPATTGDYHYTDAINDNAAAFVREHDASRPLFLYVAHTAPHWPLHARAEDIDRIKGKYLKGWDVLRTERHRRLIRMGLVDPRWPLAPRDAQSRSWSGVKLKEWFDHRMAVYAAMVTQMDRGIGKIVAALKAKGMMDNTLLIFLADNGGCAEEIGPKGRSNNFPLKTRDGRVIRLGNGTDILPGPEDTYATYGLEWSNASNTPFRRFKSFVHEGGIATPFIAHWPGVIRGGQITHQVGHVIDLMATCLDVAGAEYPSTFGGRDILPLEGKSLLPIFLGREREAHEAIFWEHEGNRAVRMGKWKLVSRHPQEWELFDLEADRTELNDLARSRPAKFRELKTAYEKWGARAGVVPWRGNQTPIGGRE